MGAVRKSNYMFEYRITVLGASAVGKTSLIHRFTQNKFIDSYNPTALDHIQHIVDYKGEMCVCLLADTCGSLDFPAMRRLSISKGNGYIVVYSVTDQRSFEEAEKIIDDIKDIKEESEDEIKIMLVANKSDCEDSQRLVNRQDGLTLAESVSTFRNVTCDFVEVSAKEGSQVISAFHGVLNMFRPEVQVEATPERRNSLSRSLSLRKSRKHKQQKLMKQNSRDDLLRKSNDDLPRQERLNKSSDDIVNDGRRDSSEETCYRERAMSLGSAGLDDEVLAKFRANYLRDLASAENSPIISRKKYSRQHSAKDVLIRTCLAAKRKLQGTKSTVSVK